MLDLIAQKKIEDFIATGFRTILGTSSVDAIEALYTAPVNKFFKIEEENDPASSHGGSVSTSYRGKENSRGGTGDSSV
jgi:hypothetical protein